MIVPASLQNELDLDGWRPDTGERALMAYFQDVGAHPTETRGDFRESTREIAQLNRKAYQPTSADQSALHDRRENHQVDIAAGHD